MYKHMCTHIPVEGRDSVQCGRDRQKDVAHDREGEGVEKIRREVRDAENRGARSARNKGGSDDVGHTCWQLAYWNTGAWTLASCLQVAESTQRLSAGHWKVKGSALQLTRKLHFSNFLCLYPSTLLP